MNNLYTAILPGYLSGSGNYVVMGIPYAFASSATKCQITQGSGASINVYTPSSVVTHSSIDFTYKSDIRRSGRNFAVIEMKFTSTQEKNKPVVVLLQNVILTLT